MKATELGARGVQPEPLAVAPRFGQPVGVEQPSRAGRRPRRTGQASEVLANPEWGSLRGRGELLAMGVRGDQDRGRVLREGDIAAGDRIEVTSRPDHGVTSSLVARALLGERRLLATALAAPELPPELRTWIQERAA